MTEISQSDTSRSHIVHLLEHQKYNEALPMLSDLMEKNPSDENRTCSWAKVKIGPAGITGFVEESF